ncbi:MAG: asparagine synthase (glutamine-hydrolyzing) [Pseudanabaenaceae cyanobacterium bins.68]|nr:asparagine synthase (glutamine-hydrolyzing) [Pseudanabaenaceae cyanobacterium bins.68]
MCGIAGIIGSSATQSIHAMQARLQHRGPDGRGVYISPNQQAAIAHTRLAILDLSSAGQQPMLSQDQRYAITFNGEIYNFGTLRQELIEAGEQFHSHSDTEVLLKLYQRIGKDCVHHLRGMFAFGIWDDLEQSCFLARDPLGIKPLYYWQDGQQLVFASELRAVLASGSVPKKLSPQGLYGYLLQGSVPEPYTLIDQVEILPAGSWLYWQAQQSKVQTYWQIKFGAAEQPEPIPTVRQALEDSIQSHLVSDVPVGLFLSGGIDSSAILAIASKFTPHLHTYSIAFSEPEWNEGNIARQVANHFGATHRELEISAIMAKPLLNQYLAALDQPTIDGFNTFCVAQLAHHHGAKVVLSGLGGDEVFGGYQSFQKIPQMVNLGKKIQSLPVFSNLIGYGFSRWGNSPKTKRLGDFLTQPASFGRAYQSLRGVFSHTEATQIARIYGAESPKLARDQDLPLAALDQVSYLELTRYMRNQLLRDSDVMSMAWGLELRVPLVDRVLLETVAQIPAPVRLAQGKQRLIDAVPELPDFLRDRPKQGFAFPFKEWIRTEWKTEFSQIPQFPGINLQTWYRQWSILVLDHWCATYLTN